MEDIIQSSDDTPKKKRRGKLTEEPEDSASDEEIKRGNEMADKINERYRRHLHERNKNYKMKIINKISMALILCVLFVHALFLLNKTYDGVSYDTYSKNVDESTNIQYFGTFPIWIVNVFCLVYFVYFMLLTFKILKIEWGGKEGK